MMQAVWNKLFFTLIVLSVGCSSNKKDDVYADVTGPEFSTSDSITFYKGKPYNGKGYELDVLWGLIFGQYTDGLRDGEWKSQTDDGQVTGVINYKAGILSGPIQMNFESGKPMMKGAFLNGAEEGRWELYYEDGQLLSYSTFINGKREGMRQEFHSDGTPWFTKYYEDGVEIKCEGDCE